jgi:hypothetical protein
MKWQKSNAKKDGIISANVNLLFDAARLALGPSQVMPKGTVPVVSWRKTLGISLRTKLSTTLHGLRMAVATVVVTFVSVLFLLMLLMAVVLEIVSPKGSVRNE